LQSNLIDKPQKFLTHIKMRSSPGPPTNLFFLLVPIQDMGSCGAKKGDEIKKQKILLTLAELCFITISFAYEQGYPIVIGTVSISLDYYLRIARNFAPTPQFALSGNSRPKRKYSCTSF
jgi:hypothetical protein